MSEKSRLMRSLFETPGKELLNLKFHRFDGAEALSEEGFCGLVNKLVFEIDAELTDASGAFGLDSAKTVNVKELAQRLA